ncbi:hypothetical protein [Snodgrassella sp. CFCC 13594]|uniref:hypothetical protein n=1 Tax=Snodgrassella sp. CFCC 13594 TaxID=1775559 RepID=UPI000834F0EB|nr:hypothetical protein [Snodgrassella sp. CFCC 13594]
MNAISFEVAFSAVFGLLTSALWAWVNSISKRISQSSEECKELRQDINNVRLAYQSRDDARRENEQITGLLKEIRADLKEVSEKLDKKADK